MSLTGDADGPPFRLGVAISDIVSGMFAFQGISMALYARTQTGRGQLVDIGMLDSTAALLTYQSGSFFATGQAPQRLGNRHPTIVPYETFSASDGDFVIAVGNDALWRAFCRACGLEALGDDPQFATNRQRVQGYGVLKPVIVERLRTKTRAEWIAVLTAAGIPCGAVRDVGEVLADPQLAAREMVQQVAHATSRSAPRDRSAGEALGHSRRRAHRAADTRPAHGRNPRRVGIQLTKRSKGGGEA